MGGGAVRYTINVPAGRSLEALARCLRNCFVPLGSVVVADDSRSVVVELDFTQQQVLRMHNFTLIKMY